MTPGSEETMKYAVEKIASGISRVRDYLDQTAKVISLSSPEKRLSQGYSIVRRGGKVLKSVKQVEKGDILDILVTDGTIKSKSI